MTDGDFFLLVLGMGVVTYIPRWLPLQYLSRKKLPEWLVQWLALIPVAILSALILPELLTTGQPRIFDLFQLKFFVALPTFAFAFWTRSLGGTVIVGMLLFWAGGKIG